MAFQSSTAIASAEQLVNAIATFAAANGWTIDRNTVTLGSRVLTLHKTGVSDYVHIYNTDVNQIRLRASVGYDSAQPPSLQPGVSPADALANGLQGPYPNVWFFADGNEINVVVRRSDTTGAYSHMAFGVLTKYGDYNGGTFVDGSYWQLTGSSTGSWNSACHGLLSFGLTNPGHVRADADGLVNKWFAINGPTSGPVDSAATGGAPLREANNYSNNQANSTFEVGRMANAADANTFSGRTILHIIEVSVRRQGDPVYMSPIGYVANTRFMSLAKFDPEQELSIADETWMVFPVVRKGAFSSVNNAPNASENNGLAIRKVV